MISSLLLGFIRAITYICNLILSPINYLILQSFPDLNDALNSISSFFSLSFRYVPWVIDALGITPLALNIIILYWSFSLSVPLFVYVIKIAVKWYHYLMP